MTTIRKALFSKNGTQFRIDCPTCPAKGALGLPLLHCCTGLYTRGQDPVPEQICPFLEVDALKDKEPGLSVPCAMTLADENEKEE